MVRSRRSSAEAPGPRRSLSGAPTSGLVATAERMVGQIEALVEEIALLRQDNELLRGELREAVAMLERASAALGGPQVSGDGRRVRRRAVAPPAGRRAGRARRDAGAAKRTRTRATPAHVTPDVVRGVIGKLGSATAAEIAAEINRHAGTKVNGRAVRFLAEQAGAQTETVDGQRRYRL